MIPTTWTPYRRDDDDELLGYLEHTTADACQARTLFGHPLGDSGSESDAERVLDALGLSYLAERWLLTLADRDEPISVQIVESSPQSLTVMSVDYGYEGDYGTPFILAVPVDPAELRPERRLG